MCNLADNVTLRALAGRTIYRLEVDECATEESAWMQYFGWLAPAVNRVAGTTTLRCLGIAPGVWLFVGSPDGDHDSCQRYYKLAAAMDGALVDVSHAYCVLRLEGEGARALLARLCPADVHPSVFPAGTCFTSNLEDHCLVIYADDDSPSVSLLIERSYAVSFWDCLVDAVTVRAGRSACVT